MPWSQKLVFFMSGVAALGDCCGAPGQLWLATILAQRRKQRAMFDRAVAALKADKATALSEFNDKNNKQFHDRDLYVFCYNISDGKFTAHPNPAVMGVDVLHLEVQGRPVRAKTIRRK